MTEGSDNGPLSLLLLLRGCVAEVFAILNPGSKAQRLLQLVSIGIGPPGGQLTADGDGFLDRGQRLFPPARRPGQPPGCSATWPGQGGTRLAAPRPAPGRYRRPPGSRPALPSAAPGRPGGAPAALSDMARRRRRSSPRIPLDSPTKASVASRLRGASCTARVTRSSRPDGPAAMPSSMKRGSAAAISSSRAARTAGWVKARARQLDQQLRQHRGLPGLPCSQAGGGGDQGGAARCRLGAARRPGPAAEGSSSPIRDTAGAPTPPAPRRRGG